MDKFIRCLVIAGMILALLAGLLVTGCSSSDDSDTVFIPPAKIGDKQYAEAPDMFIKTSHDYTAVIHTNKGDITVELFPREVPATVNNFVFLAQDNFYDGITFHRIEKGNWIQAGDPTGTGIGGPGYEFEDEPISREYETGTVAMANKGPDTNGSQFFICDGDLSGDEETGEGGLPKNYTIFGQVTDGIDVVHAIAASPVEMNDYGELSKPAVELYIESIDIIETE